MTIYSTLMNKYQRLLTNDYQISTKDYVRIYKLFMQNKPNFRNTKIGISSFITMRYGDLGDLIDLKTKPIQTQYKANLTQNKPNLTQYKAKTNPISNGPSAHGHREIQITFDLAIGVSIESYITQKSSVVSEIMERVSNMSISNSKKVSLALTATGIISGVADAARNNAVSKLMAGIRDDDAKVRTEAWQSAGQVGAAAVKPLAGVMTNKEPEVARAAKRGLWKIVRHVGRPKAGNQKRAVMGKLVELLGDDQPVPVRREVLWMLSEIGNRQSIKPIAALLSDKELREDARMTLQRIPGRGAVAALRAALKAAPDDFKLNIAQSLRQRGAKVRGLDCIKLIPTKQTNVKSLK